MRGWPVQVARRKQCECTRKRIWERDAGAPPARDSGTSWVQLCLSRGEQQTTNSLPARKRAARAFDVWRRGASEF